jgi:hypothetical protein
MGLFDSGESEEDNESTAGFSTGGELGGFGKNARRVIDREAGVVIYSITYGDERSITAVPIGDTDLQIEE